MRVWNREGPVWALAGRGEMRILAWPAGEQWPGAEEWSGRKEESFGELWWR